MDKKDYELWNNITFKTNGYRKNFDFVNDNENIITKYEGVISEVRISEQKPPFIVGEYGFSVWNIELGKRFNVDLIKLIEEHKIENTYSELMNMIKRNEIDINDFKKILLIHTFILHKDYRKCGITQEFVEMIYRDFYWDSTMIIALVLPFQYNPIDADYYMKRRWVHVRERLKSQEGNYVPTMDYYSLQDFMKKEDVEVNEFKLFSVASKCGFNRIDESHLFMFNPKKIVERMTEKHEYIKTHEK